MKPLEIEVRNHGNVNWFNFENRGTDYSLRKYNDEWELWSKRKAASFDPKIRFFNFLEDIEKSIKSLKGISLILKDII